MRSVSFPATAAVSVCLCVHYICYYCDINSISSGNENRVDGGGAIVIERILSVS